MDFIFHEKQEGFLCAQHCLNALLQDHYFTAVDLAEIARQLDHDERLHLTDNSENGSENMDDSGYFSIQVITKALSVWGLELIPISRQQVITSDTLDNKVAFICHFRQHWFTIRRLASQWFNLNSMLSQPQLFQEGYLCLYLTQLQHEGYSIFQINGILPPCEAEQIIQINPVLATPANTGGLPSQTTNTSPGDNYMDEYDDNDEMLKLALAESLKNSEAEDVTLQKVLVSTASYFDRDLESAIKLSLETTDTRCQTNTELQTTNLTHKQPLPVPVERLLPETSAVRHPHGIATAEDIRSKRQDFLDKLTRGNNNNNNN